MTVTIGREGHPEGNCERCGKYSSFLWTVGRETKGKTYCIHYMCDRCHEQWKVYRDSDNPEGKELNWLDNLLGVFIQNGREVVQFT